MMAQVDRHRSARAAVGHADFRRLAAVAEVVPSPPSSRLVAHHLSRPDALGVEYRPAPVADPAPAARPAALP